MKLFFNKNAEGDITATMQDGTTTREFDYLLMLKQLLNNNEIEDPEFTNIDEDEQNKIKDLLSQFQYVIKEGSAQTTA